MTAMVTLHETHSDRCRVCRGVTWSPAGDALAFGRLEFLEGERRRSQLVTVSQDGTSTKTVASYSGMSASRLVIDWPQWSPDGRSILLERRNASDGLGRAFVAATPD